MIEILIRFRNGRLRKELVNDAISQMVVENAEGIIPLQLAHIHDKEKAVFFLKEHVEEAYHVNKKGSSFLYIATLNGETKLLRNIFNTVPRYVYLNVLDDQLMNGKSLLLAAIWSQKISKF